MKKLIVDRVENNIAVCEVMGDTMIGMPLSILPEGTKEGSVLVHSGGNWVLLPEEEQARKEKLFELAQSLFDE